MMPDASFGPVFIITPPNHCHPHCNVHCSVVVVIFVVVVVMWWSSTHCVVVVCCNGPQSLWLPWVVV